MSAPHDWAAGPAKWAAVVVLGGASIFGLAWSAATRAPGSVQLPISKVKGSSGPPPPAPGATPEALQADPAPNPDSEPTAPPSSSAARRININTATASELELLPGIGPAMASRIIEYRKTNGRFRNVEDLDDVKGIGPRTLEKLRPLIRVE